MADAQCDKIRFSLSRIFKSGEYSDMTICCGEREFKVHRAIVSPQCPFFAAACDGEFQESINRKILLDEDDADAVERMLSYLYSFDYDDGSSAERNADAGENGSTQLVKATRSRMFEATPKIMELDETQTIVDGFEGSSLLKGSELLNNVRVYAIADKYGILGLKALAKAKFLSQSNSLLSSSDFPEIIRATYKSTPESDRALRSVVSAICAKHVRELIETDAFQSVVGDVGEFGYDVLCAALRADDEQLSQALGQKAALQKKIKDGKLEIMHHDAELKRTQEILQQAVAAANERESCRQCSGNYRRR